MNNVYKTLNYYAYVINIMTVFTQKPTSRFSIGPCKMQLHKYTMLNTYYTMICIVQYISDEERLLDIYADPGEIEIDENYSGLQINFPLLELDNVLDLVRYFQQGKVCTLPEFSGC